MRNRGLKLNNLIGSSRHFYVFVFEKVTMSFIDNLFHKIYQVTLLGGKNLTFFMPVPRDCALRLAHFSNFLLIITQLCCIILFTVAGIAQLVEQLIRNEQVACSSHVSSSTKKESFVFRTKDSFFELSVPCGT